MESKYCPRCDQTLLLDQFYAIKGKPSCYCKTCHKKTVTKSQRSNPEKAKAKDKRDYERKKSDPAKMEKQKGLIADWFKKNRDKANAAHRRHLDNLKSDPLNYKIMVAVSNNNRRAKRLGLHGRLTREALEECLSVFGYKCAYCGGKDDLGFDHIIPMASGGENELTNVAAACFTCNHYKNDTDVFVFAAQRGFDANAVIAKAKTAKVN